MKSVRGGGGCWGLNFIGSQNFINKFCHSLASKLLLKIDWLVQTGSIKTFQLINLAKKHRFWLILLEMYHCTCNYSFIVLSRNFNKFSYASYAIFQTLKNMLKIKGRIRSGGFLRIFTVVYLLFLATAGGFNPTGHSLIQT